MMRANQSCEVEGLVLDRISSAVVLVSWMAARMEENWELEG
jgi:hypothetical protein